MATKSIYVIKNNVNNKVYVGQAKNPHRRFIQHLSDGTCQVDNLPIHSAINKYGKENFYYEILESNVKNYNELEKYWIRKFNSQAPNGYNILEGGEENPVMKGANNPNSQIDENIAHNIIKDLTYSNLSQRKIALKYRCTERIINSINAGETWRCEDMKYPIRKGFCHFSTKILEEIRFLLASTNFSLSSIATVYGFTKGTIAQINRGNSHRDLNIKYPLRNEEIKGEKVSTDDVVKFLRLHYKENVK